MWGIMGFGGLFVDNYQLPPDADEAGEAVDKKRDPLAPGRISWGGPRQHEWHFSDAVKSFSGSEDRDGSQWGQASTASEAAGLVAAASAVAAAAQPPPAMALALAARLVEGSQAAGITGKCLDTHGNKHPYASVTSDAVLLRVEAGAAGGVRNTAVNSCSHPLWRAKMSLAPLQGQSSCQGQLSIFPNLASDHRSHACHNGFPPADVTRRASQLLLAYRGMMTPPQLARLAARMAELGMVQEINSLVDGAVTNGSHQSQAVGFVAAGLTGAAQE
jgi:hypothetical protein